MSFSIECVDPLRLPLVNRFYKNCRYSAKAGRGELVYALHQEGSIQAATRLVPYSFRGQDLQQLMTLTGSERRTDHCLFLRSMCVQAEKRGQGLGTALLQAVIEPLNKAFSYCYPFSHLHDFYAQIGFKQVAQEQVPGFIAEPYQRYCRQGRDIIIMVRIESVL